MKRKRYLDFVEAIKRKLLPCGQKKKVQLLVLDGDLIFLNTKHYVLLSPPLNLTHSVNQLVRTPFPSGSPKGLSREEED